MALSEIVTSFNVHDYFGHDFDARRAKGWATTNIADDTIHDTATGETRIGSAYADIAADGTGTFTHWAPGADGNPTSWQTTYHFDVPDRAAPKGRRQESFGPFTVTTTGLLTALVEEQEVPAEYLTTVTAALQELVDEAQAAADLATSISGISTPDGVVEALIQDSGSDTSAALAASTAATVLINRTATMNLRKEVTPSGSNDTAAVNAALAAFAAAGGGKVIIPRDNWLFTGSTGLALTGTSNPIHIEAEPGTVFDMTGNTAAIGMLFGGGLSTSAALGADVARGAVVVNCATVAAVVVPGDLIRIRSTVLWETLSANVFKGELAEVLSVTGSNITLKSALWDSYTAATTTIHKLQMPRVSVEGLTLTRNGDNTGLQVSYARDVLLGGLRGQGARAAMFYLDTVFNATVDNITARDFWSAATDAYGLSVGSSQHVKEIGLDLRGGRHAITHGGSQPCRDIQTIGGTFDSYHPSVIACFDYHGGVEGASIRGGTQILNGININGVNVEVDARIRGTNRHAVVIGPARDGVNNYVKIKGDIETMPGSAMDGVQYLPRNGTNPTTLGLLEINATIRADAAGVRIEPLNSTTTGATIDRLVIKGDVLAGGASAAVQIGLSTAAYVGINEAEFDGRFRTLDSNAMSLLGTSTGTAVFRGSYVATGTNRRPIDCKMFSHVDVRHAVLKGATPFRSQFENAGGLYLSDVVIDGAFTNAFIATTNVTEVLQANVRRINGAGVPLLPGRHFSHIDGGGKVTTQGTAAPTTGAWNVGDRCWNTATAAAGVPGWVCTTAGTPGTWKAMAVVAA